MRPKDDVLLEARVDFFNSAVRSINLLGVAVQTNSETKYEDEDDKEVEALMRTAVSQFEQYIKLNRKIPPEVLVSINQIEEPGKLADTIASHLSLKIP